MPRARLDAAAVVAAAAGLADENHGHVPMGLLAERLGVRAPSLYKHVGGRADLGHRIAALAATELSDALREAMRGRTGRAALAAAAYTIRAYVLNHPGRYATIDTSAVLRGYPLDPALRSVVHGFATLEQAGGFGLDTDVDESFERLITMVDQALRTRPGRRPGPRP